MEWQTELPTEPGIWLRWDGELDTMILRRTDDGLRFHGGDIPGFLDGGYTGGIWLGPLPEWGEMGYQPPTLEETSAAIRLDLAESRRTGRTLKTTLEECAKAT